MGRRFGPSSRLIPEGQLSRDRVVACPMTLQLMDGYCMRS